MQATVLLGMAGETSFVGHGWGDVLHVFSAGDGIIYDIAPSGELRWYRHLGYLHGGGLATWEPQDTGYKVV
jgi:hypothetical protein